MPGVLRFGHKEGIRDVRTDWHGWSWPLSSWSVSAPSFVAVYRWWFGGGKLLNDRLSDLPASAVPQAPLDAGTRRPHR